MENDQTSGHAFDLNLICEYFAGLERQGPGSPESTIKALSFIDTVGDIIRISFAIFIISFFILIVNPPQVETLECSGFFGPH